MSDSSLVKKPFYKRWWFIAIVVLVLIGALVPREKETNPTESAAGQASTPTAVEPVSAPAAPEVQEPGERITLANFNKVRTGMSVEKVFDILGPGEVMSESGEGEYHTIMYSWKADNGIANMNVMFQGGEVLSKAQLGLE